MTQSLPTWGASLTRCFIYTSVSSPVNCKSYTRFRFLQYILWNSLRTQGPFQKARAGLGDVRTGRTQGPWCRLHSDYYFGIVHTFLFENGLLFFVIVCVTNNSNLSCPKLNSTFYYLLHQTIPFPSPRLHLWGIQGEKTHHHPNSSLFLTRSSPQHPINNQSAIMSYLKGNKDTERRNRSLRLQYL